MSWWCLLDTISKKIKKNKHALHLASQLWQSTFSPGKGNRNSNKNSRSVWRRRQKKDSRVRKKGKGQKEMCRIRVGYWGKTWGVWWGCDANRQHFLRTSLQSFLLGTWRCLLSADHMKGKGQSDRDTQPWISGHFGSLWVSPSDQRWRRLSIFGSSQVYVMQWDQQYLERGYLSLFDFWKEAARLSLDLGNTECKSIFSDINSSRSMIVLLQCGKRSERVRAAEQ